MQTQSNKNLANQEPQIPSNGVLSDYIVTIIKHHKFIGIIVGTTFILSIIVSLLLPKMYIATARILPPRENNAGLTSLLASAETPLGGLAGSLFTNQTPAALYVGILKSRSVSDALEQQFNLRQLYGLKYIEDVYSKLEDRTSIVISKKDQIVRVSVMDRDPQRAADMANAYIAILDKINRKLNNTEGKRKRLFLEDRLKEVRSNLVKAETDLKAFQERYQLVSIEEQARVTIEGAADIKSKIIAAQTELEVFKKFGTDRQIEAVMLKAKIDELQKQLVNIEQGKNPNAQADNFTQTGDSSNFYIPFDELPRLGLQLIRFSREAKIHEKLFELLTAQYEMARIEEAKNVDTIQVLDKAVALKKKVAPKRSRIILSMTFFSFIISAILVLCKEYQWTFRKIA
jgi:tyrosine-protein kinase Etk/Wzc